MTTKTLAKGDAVKVIYDVLADIAPEVDASEIDMSVDLTEQLDLDSMDYLHWLVGINAATGIEIPDRDASHFMTIDGAAKYLSDASAKG
ncbi:MAG: phosphopantetheine-binding protein [Acidimicrobiia bacterium]|nr:phosphopantetheine-binding protein [Acidimicrobiia bacterium]